jgi:hypothetical protein
LKRALLVLVAACGGSTQGPLPGEPLDNNPRPRVGNLPCAGATDSDGDGIDDLTWEYSYDDRGRSIKDVGHYTAGGRDAIATYAWDNLDHLTAWEQTNAPGEQRMDYTATYDTIGNNVGYSMVDIYTPQNYSQYRVTSSGFDDLGHPQKSLIIVPNIPNSVMTYTYDELGRLIERAQDTGSDGSIDSRATITYDDDARTTTTTTTNSDGSHDVVVRTYDQRGKPLSYQRDSVEMDGSRHTYEYDYEWSGDRLLSDTATYDGSVITRDTYRYDCPTVRVGRRPSPRR